MNIGRDNNHKGSHNGVSFLVDNLKHQFIDTLHHVLTVTLESRLKAGIIEELPHDQTGLIRRALPKLVQLHHQLVLLVELEGYLPQLGSRLACLRLLLHERAHEGHLPHARRDRRDDQGWTEELLGGDDHLADIGLQFVLDP